jgi:hypothetical protein
VSTATVIVIVIVAVLLLAMLVAGGRKAARLHARHLGPAEEDPHEYRSHAEASRGGGI